MCYLQPTLGAAEIQLSQQCGGYIDPVSLNRTGFVQRDGSNSDVVKGFICPLGQICREDENPDSGLESFDTVYMSALQVFIVASANGVSFFTFAV